MSDKLPNGVNGVQNKKEDSKKKKDKGYDQHWLQKTNMVLGIIVVVMTVLAFLDLRSNSGLFILVFIFGGIMCLIASIKNLYGRKNLKGYVLLFICVILFAVGIVALLSLGK